MASASREIIFIGDSLTEAYDWQGLFPSDTVRNLGSSGEPVEGMLDRLKRLRVFKSPDYLFIMSGINNLRHRDHDITDRYREALDFVAREMTGTTIVVQSILPAVYWVPPDIIVRINRVLRSMAESRGMVYMDLHTLFLDAGGRPDPAFFTEDGIHLSENGYAVWSGAVEKFLNGQNNLPEVAK